MNTWDCNYFDLDFHDFFEFDFKVKSIIDLGCGNGSQAYFLEDMGYDVTGTDIQNQLKYFISNFIIDDALNSRLNKKYDVILDRGLIHNLYHDERRDNYFDMIDRISHDDTTILLKVLSPYEIRCNPYFEDPDGPYRFHEDELEYLYYPKFKCDLIEDTYFYTDNVQPHLRGYYCVYSRDIK